VVFADLALEGKQHHFCQPLFVQAVAILPRLKGREHTSFLFMGEIFIKYKFGQVTSHSKLFLFHPLQ
jgi:hypothetical protein